MMSFLKQSTATTLLLGPFLDETDGQTAETSLTISQGDVLLWKEGGTTLAQKNESTSCTHRSNGLYTCPVNSTDTGTLGVLVVSVDEAGAMPIRQNYIVLPANIYDAWVAGTDFQKVDLHYWLDTLQTAQPTTAAAVASAVWEEAVASHAVSGTTGQRISRIPNAAAGGSGGLPTVDANNGVQLQNGTGTGQVSLSSGLVRLSSTGVSDILTTAMTEAYNTDGSTMTIAQALYGIFQFLTEKSVSSTTMTIKKLNGSTTAYTLTLDDDEAPTSITRAT